MRIVPLLLLFTLLTLASPALAQEQEKKLSERLSRKLTDKATQEMVFDTRQASFSGGRTFNSKAAHSKSFHYTQKTAAKEFRSKEFAGSKSAWMGNFKFSSREANTSGKYTIPNATRQVNTKVMNVADARESSKEMGTRDFSGQRPFLNRGKSQDRFDRDGQEALTNGKPVGWQGQLQEMTIDDVRDLLNKNK